MDTQLRLVNHSHDTNNSEIVIFQKNVATDFDELAVAWKVIRFLGLGDYHPFVLPAEMQVSASDSYGNFTPHLNAKDGELFAMELSASGNILVKKGNGTSSREVQVLNDLPRGAINANIFTDGKLVATKTSIAPAQKAVFQFKPTIWIGVVSQITEGSVLNSAIISDINTEISLLGIASADIVMTGGGGGRESHPFEFILENVVLG